MTDSTTPQQWQRIELLLDQALDLPVDQRAAFLNRACAGEDALRTAVERLLRACEASGEFMAEPAVRYAAPVLARQPDDHPMPAAGDRIGPYRLVSEAGRGGMAVVYLAERDDGEFRMRVALKLVSLGAIPGGDLLRRFREERQILATLDHPGIARLLDGGVTEDGLPWFAMEYVEGEPIERYSDGRNLDVEARLTLFGAVCDAVQHAHERNVVHRDLKPGNILVTADGRIKLLDFGIAKLLGPGAGDVPAEQTRPGLRLMTPEFASPEQVRGDAITPATDVYALGVLLYRLLCGRHPYPLSDDAGDGVERAVLDTLPEPPSKALLREMPGRTRPTPASVAGVRSTTVGSLTRRLRGDLDAIVLQALHKTPGQRYASAGAMAADLRQSRDGGPVGARRQAQQRRARALLRRYGVMAATGSLALALGAYLATARFGGPALDPQRVVVAPLENRTGRTDLNEVGRIAADWIIQGLSHTGLVDVVPVTSAFTALDFVQQTPGDLDAVGRIRLLARETRAGIVVSGAYDQQGDSLYLWLIVTDARRDRVLHALEPIATPIALPLDGIGQLRRRLMAALATHLNPRMRDHAARTGLTPPSFEAYRAHAEGLELFIERDWVAAVASFAAAARQDSTFLAPLLFSGLAFLNLSDSEAAESIVVQARPRLHLLHEVDRPAFEYLEARVRGDLPAAHHAYRRSPELAPGGLAHWGLASSALWVNRPRETIRVSRQLDPDRGELRGWFFYWRDLVRAHHRLGEHREELRVVRRARARFPASSEAVVLEARALAALGRHRDLRRLLSEPLHPGRTPWGLMQAAGLELLAHGEATAAGTLLRAATDLHRTHRSDDPRSRFFLAESHRLAGDLDEAERLLHDLAVDDPQVLTMNVQGMLGGLAARRGDTEAAARISRSLTEMESPASRGGISYFRARIASLLGEREEALRLLQQSLREGLLDFWLVVHTEPDLAGLRDYPLFQEFIRPRG